MLKSFEYVDPLLAQKIHSLQSELKKVQQSREEIHNNKKLTVATRQKLLKYQTQCSNTIEKLLNEEKDKLAQYLDEQTNAITKTSRLSTSRMGKINQTLNQSTRIDLSTDDNKSLDATKAEINRKITSFYVPETERQPISNTKYGNSSLVRIKRLKKKVSNQQKLIKMLVTWIKIYYEREQQTKLNHDVNVLAQNEAIKRQNADLLIKCQRLNDQIIEIRQQFKHRTLNILQTQKKYDQIRNQNSGLKFQRKQLLSNARSLKKTIKS